MIGSNPFLWRHLWYMPFNQDLFKFRVKWKSNIQFAVFRLGDSYQLSLKIDVTAFELGHL